jgi:hypothetical protein
LGHHARREYWWLGWAAEDGQTSTIYAINYSMEHFAGGGGTAQPSESKKIGAADNRQVDVTVLALIPTYHQVEVRAEDGSRYSLTRHTQGIDLAELHEGQRLRCTVTVRLPRVLNAQVLA